MVNDLLADRISYLAETTHMTNAEIARELNCSERSVRRYAGEWKARMMHTRSAHALQGDERKAILLYDPHIPYQDDRAYEIAMDYAQEWQPDDIILGGDFADFKHVSFWKDAPGRSNLSDEINVVKHYLSVLRAAFPIQRIVYLEGNHEARLARYLYTKAPELYGLPELTVPTLLKLGELDIQYVSNISLLNHGQKPFCLGKLSVLHGHEVKVSWDGVNIARTMYLKTHANIIFGHNHQSQQFIFKKLNGKHESSTMVGSLCQLSEP